MLERIYIHEQCIRMRALVFQLYVCARSLRCPQHAQPPPTAQLIFNSCLRALESKFL